MLYGGRETLAQAVERLCAQAVEAVEDGTDILVLSDRGVDATHAPIPALLANQSNLAAVDAAKRTRVNAALLLAAASPEFIVQK